MERPQRNGFLKQLGTLDFFPKAAEDVRVRASSGAAVTFIGGLVMLLLFVSEMILFTQVVTEDTIFVDTTREKVMCVNFELVFLRLPCKDVAVDITDSFGEPQAGRREIQQQGINPQQYLHQTSTFWFSPSSTTADDLLSGCRVFGRAEVQKIKGSLHIAAGGGHIPQVRLRSGDGHVHHVTKETLTTFNASHFISHLSFGPSFPRRTDPLSWTRIIEPNAMQVNHLIQLVPTIYEDWSGRVTEGYQYAAQTNFKHLAPEATSFPLPGVFFKWDLSPFVIRYRETGRSFSHFITRVCAITGGTFVVLGLVYNALSTAFPAAWRPVHLSRQ